MANKSDLASVEAQWLIYLECIVVELREPMQNTLNYLASMPSSRPIWPILDSADMGVGFIV